MQLFLRFFLLCAISSQSLGLVEVATGEGPEAIVVETPVVVDSSVVVDPVPVVVVKDANPTSPREKRQTMFHSPIQYDSTLPHPHPNPQHQSVGLLPNLPILGTLVGNLGGQGGLLGGHGGLLGGLLGSQGGLLGGQGGGGLLGGLPGQFGSTLGGVTNGLGNLGSLGNLGGLGLGNLAGVGGTAGGLACPANQKLNCKCESLLPAKPLIRRQGLEILQHIERSNEDGSRELSALLSNGLSVYQKSGRDLNSQFQEVPVTEGFYSLKLQEKRFLTIYYTINDLDYTVKADVTQESPKTGLESKK